MPAMYFLKSGRIISGPFEQARLLVMLKTGKLKSTDQLSTDKVMWSGLKDVLVMIHPSMIDQLCSKANVTSAPRSAQSFSAEELQQTNTDAPEINYGQAAELPVLEDTACQLNCTRWRIFSDTIASAGNGSCFLQRIYHKGRSALVASCMMALLLSAVITLGGAALFQSHSVGDKLWLYLRSLLWVISCGGIFFICNSLLLLISNPADSRISGICMLTGSHTMLNLAILTTFSHGLIFTVMPCWHWQNTAILACGIAGFVWFNTFITLRTCLLLGGKFGAGWASFWAFLGIWLSVLLYMIIMLPIYQ